MNKENIKCTRKLISKVISTKKGNCQHTIEKLLRDNRIYVYNQSICDELRLLQTFAGVLREKIRNRAVFKKTHTNYISIERL